MSKLKIESNGKYFRSDSFAHGRITKALFDKLADIVIKKNWETHNAYKKLFPNEVFLPLSQGERIQYALFGSALSEITPMYMSECPFNKSKIGDDLDKNRRIDFWCLSKDGASGKSINFFIELKKAYYCTSEGTNRKLTSAASDKIGELIRQLETIQKNIEPDWYGDGEVYLGILVLHGYRNHDKTPGFDQNVVVEEVAKKAENEIGRNNLHMLVKTWILPDAVSPWGNGDVCQFISIIGFMLSKKN